MERGWGARNERRPWAAPAAETPEKAWLTVLNPQLDSCACLIHSRLLAARDNDAVSV